MDASTALGLAAAFACGSLPFGYWLPRLLHGIDIRRHGSGNPGATNVLRTVGRPTGLVVGMLDFLKGFAGVMLMERLSPGSGSSGKIAAALAAVAGHNWTPWLGFRGGKGILTSAGAFTRLAWLPVAGAALCFVLAFALFGFVSVGSLVAAAALPVLVVLIPGPWQTPQIEIAAAVITAAAFLRHRSNIRNLLAGSELRATPVRAPRPPRPGRRRAP